MKSLRTTFGSTLALMAALVLAGCTVVPQERVVYQESSTVYRTGSTVHEPDVVIIDRGPVYRSAPIYIEPAPVFIRPAPRFHHGYGSGSGYRHGYRDGRRFDDRRRSGGATYTGPSPGRSGFTGNPGVNRGGNRSGGSGGVADTRPPTPSPFIDRRSFTQRPSVPRGVTSAAPATRPAPAMTERIRPGTGGGERSLQRALDALR